MNKKRFLSTLTILLTHSNLALGALGDEDNDRYRPAHHICPITHAVMEDPVQASDNKVYERKAIEEWFRRSGNNPTPTVLGQALPNRDLVPQDSLKQEILAWARCRQAEPSALQELTAEDLASRLTDAFTSNAALLTPEKGAKDQDIVAVLGNTGAGKSTLVNLLAGKRLSATPDNQDYILEDATDPTAMRIGTGADSETMYPQSIDVGGLRVFDFPGFNDTDGSVRNLVNAAFIRKILREAKSVRFVLVGDQSQFTTDRGASIKDMSFSINKLFGVQDVDLTKNGVFVVTKLSSDFANNRDSIADYLLRKTRSRDKEAIHRKLQAWKRNEGIYGIFQPARHDWNESTRAELLTRIHAITPIEIRDINVSALYPSNTQGDLVRMFNTIMEDTFARDRGRIFNHTREAPPVLSKYASEIARYGSPTFWDDFGAHLSAEGSAVGLLKEFCETPYNNALEAFRSAKEEERQAHIKRLEEKQQARLTDIQARTRARIMDVIAEVGEERVVDPSCDSAYQKDYEEGVCAPHSISLLATDEREQKEVKEFYRDFIIRHNQAQRENGLGEILALVRSQQEMITKQQDMITRLEKLMGESLGGRADNSRAARRPSA